MHGAEVLSSRITKDQILFDGSMALINKKGVKGGFRGYCSWMYRQGTPMGNPYISPIFRGYL